MLSTINLEMFAFTEILFGHPENFTGNARISSAQLLSRLIEITPSARVEETRDRLYRDRGKFYSALKIDRVTQPMILRNPRTVGVK